MIKAAGKLAGGAPFVMLGLSDENWVRLRAGQPIRVRLREMHPDLPELTVILIGGENEDSLNEDLRSVGWRQ